MVSWCARNTPADGAEVFPLSQVARAEWSGLWVRQYLWVHEDWSPAIEAPLRELAGQLVDDADPEASTVTVRDSRVEAVTWVFNAGPDAADVVAETVERQAAAGTADVAAGLSRSLSLLHRRGVRKAAIDGHVTDPHLTAVLETFPRVPTEPLLLVELSR